jgi:hypothetical protein
MKYLIKIRNWLIGIILFAAVVWGLFFNWSFIFKKKVVGEVVAAEKVIAPLAVIGNSNAQINSQVFSFSVAIKDRNSGEIYMASSEDRQWAAVQSGNCVVAAYFPYPPWYLSKGGTYHNARLLRNFTSCEQMPAEKGGLGKIKFFFLLD